MVGLDPFPGQVQRRERVLRAGRDRCVDLLLRDPQGVGREFETVEPARVVDDRLVAPGHHVLDDAADRLVDVLGDFALHREKIGEGARKPGLPRVETLRHQTRPGARVGAVS